MEVGDTYFLGLTVSAVILVAVRSSLIHIFDIGHHLKQYSNLG